MAALTGSSASLGARASLLANLVARPVDAGTLWQVRDAFFASQWARGSAEAQRGLALLRESSLAHETVERLAADFERLFLSADARIEPRESFYQPGCATEELCGIYREAAFDPVDALPPDHLATELRYFAQLCLQGFDRTALGFVRDHLKPWAGECFAEISVSAASLLYQGVGALGMDYIESLPARPY